MGSNQASSEPLRTGLPAISIVVPALNEERFLGECLESLRSQSYSGSYEVIVVDNGSTDRSREIAQRHGVRLVSCPERGVIPAREFGVRVARAPIVIQADADTLYPREWLARMARHFTRHPKAVAVGGPFLYRDPPSWAWVEYIFRTIINFLAIWLAHRPIFVSGANFGFRREAFALTGGYRANVISPDQLDIASRLKRFGSIYWDNGMAVLTSSRRVQKPFIVILGEGVANCLRAFDYARLVWAARVQRLFVGRAAVRNFARSLPVVVIAVFLSVGYFVPGSQVFGTVYYQDKSLDRVVALTFDDGPNEPYTSELLDILAQYNVKATFFTIGQNVELYPDTARRIVAEGHVIGNHSYSHDANHALDPAGGKDITLAQQSIIAVAGVAPHLYRPPHGKKSPWELNYLKQENLIGVTWAIAANEAMVKTPEQLAREITDRERNGRVILLHDGYGAIHNGPESDKSITVKALPLIIDTLQREGYTFVTVPELFKVPAYN